MPRSVKEWIGKTDDTKIPARVKARIYEKANGVCHVCKLPIEIGDPWDADHLLAIINGGENRESNLAPAHEKGCHPKKTKQDLATKSKTARIKKRYIGIKPDKKKIQSAPFQKSEKPPKKQSKLDQIRALPRRKFTK